MPIIRNENCCKVRELKQEMNDEQNATIWMYCWADACRRSGNANVSVGLHFRGCFTVMTDGSGG